MRRKIVLFLALISYKIIIFILSSRQIPEYIKIGNFDMVLHMGEYFPLGILWFLFLREFRIKFVFLISFIFSSLYAISDEIHQLYVPGRIASCRDVIADTAGILLGLYIIKRWQK